MLDVDKFAREGVLRILVGNKSDLDHKRQISYDNGKELAEKYGIMFMETSAKETVNIDNLFESATKSFLGKQVSGSGSKTTPTGKGINLNEENMGDDKKNSGICC